ncbi:MAG TPA: hypothetical protein VHR42_01915 [Clostridia bacterium]|nr:hypothetical protein [Clostridia bacterium]
MKNCKLTLLCLSLLLVTAAGCSMQNGETAGSSVISSSEINRPSVSSQVPSSSSQPPVLSSSSVPADSAGSQPASGNASSGSKVVKSASSAAKVVSQAESKSSQVSPTWVAYIDNDHHLHVKKKDGSNDKILVKDVEEAPCVAGDWVYFLPDLNEIDKVKLDGSQRTKVCSTDPFIVYNANLNISHEINGSSSVTAEYKDGYILYTCFQLKEVGEEKTNPPSYYKLDLAQNKLIPVKK